MYDGDGDGEDDANLKVCFYFTLESLIKLDLFSVSVGIKTCLSLICYEMRSVSNKNTKN